MDRYFKDFGRRRGEAKFSRISLDTYQESQFKIRLTYTH